MIPVKSNTHTLKVIEVISEGPAVIKQMHKPVSRSGWKVVALLGCFLLGAGTAFVLLRAIFQ